MQDAALVGIMHRAGDGGHQLRRGAGILRKAAGMRREIAAVDQLHAEVMMPLVHADLVDRHDVGMIQMRRGLSFQAKPLEVVGRREPPGADHLQRQHAVQADLPGLEDDPHSPFRDHLDQLVIAEVADAIRRGRRGVRLAAGRAGDVEFSTLSRPFPRDGLPERNDGRRRVGRIKIRRHTRRIDGRPMVPERGGHPIKMVLVGEERRQLGGEVGMLRQQPRAVRRSGGFEIFQVGRDDLVEPRFAIVFGPSATTSRARGDAGHAFASRWLAGTAFRPFYPTVTSPRDEPVVADRGFKDSRFKI